MKKLVCLLLLSLLFLSACLPFLPRRAGQAFASKEVSRTFTGTYQKSHVEMKLTYRGKDLQNLSFSMLLPPTTETAGLQDLSPEEVEAVLEELMQSNPDYAELQAIDGLSVRLELLPDKESPQLILELVPDKLDRKKANKSSFLEKTKILALLNVQPKELSQVMVEWGYKEKQE